MTAGLLQPTAMLLSGRRHTTLFPVKNPSPARYANHLSLLSLVVVMVLNALTTQLISLKAVCENLFICLVQCVFVVRFLFS